MVDMEMEVSFGRAASTKISYGVEGNDLEWGRSWAKMP